MIVVTHDREFAETYGDRIIELADGRVAADGAADGAGQGTVVQG